MSDERPFKIAIQALGGQGGGILSGWIVKLGERAGYIAQSTSVPGVAQRTGATIYYIELFPRRLAEARQQDPVLALMPVPGDVDIVLASEIMEAGRAIDRGFVTGNTTLIASSHRVYAIGEKIGMGDARSSPESIYAAAQKAAGRFLVADMQTCAETTASIISSVLFGALAGAGALPIPREDFEAVIRVQGRAVERNLAGFAAGFDALRPDRGAAPLPATDAKTAKSNTAPAVRPLSARLTTEFPAAVQAMALEGLKRVVDYQDPHYGTLYLDRLRTILALDDGHADYRLTTSVAKHLALWMAYDDVVRVADLKTRARRFSRFRRDVVAAPGQIVHVFEYLHPRIEELCDLLPPGIAKWVLASPAARRVLGLFFGKGRRLPTTRLRGFLPLYLLASFRFLRRSSYRYRQETARIESWLALIRDAAGHDRAFATEIAALQRLIKGYGDTHARGLANFSAITATAVVDALQRQPVPAEATRRLHEAALADENGVALKAALAQLNRKSPAAYSPAARPDSARG